jgi:hypothetical protein
MHRRAGLVPRYKDRPNGQRMDRGGGRFTDKRNGAALPSTDTAGRLGSTGERTGSARVRAGRLGLDRGGFFFTFAKSLNEKAHAVASPGSEQHMAFHFVRLPVPQPPTRRLPAMAGLNNVSCLLAKATEHGPGHVIQLNAQTC